VSATPPQARVRELTLHLEVPFAISRATRTEKSVVLVEWRDDGHLARGEGSPDPFFGETSESVRADIEASLELMPADPLALSGFQRALRARFPHGGAARCALDVLAHDRAAQHLGMPLRRWLRVPTLDRHPRRSPLGWPSRASWRSEPRSRPPQVFRSSR
jgi:L-alanine-DL-glutamate epimerase-like enolase superfamily enzyme